MPIFWVNRFSVFVCRFTETNFITCVYLFAAKKQSDMAKLKEWMLNLG